MTQDITASELQAGMTIDECEAEPGLVGWKVLDVVTVFDCTGEVADETPLTLERETGFKPGLPAMTVYYDKPMHLPAKPAESVTETRSAYLRATDKVRVTE